MRVTTLLIFALLFTVTPFYLLDAVVMPQLLVLKDTYSHADEIAQRAAGK